MIKKLAYFNITVGIIISFVGLSLNYKEEIITFYKEKGTKTFTKEVKIEPKFMCIICGLWDAVLKDKETGIYIIPITALKD